MLRHSSIYASDLSNQEWAVLCPLLLPTKSGGRPRPGRPWITTFVSSAAPACGSACTRRFESGCAAACEETLNRVLALSTDSRSKPRE